LGKHASAGLLLAFAACFWRVLLQFDGKRKAAVLTALPPNFCLLFATLRAARPPLAVVLAKAFDADLLQQDDCSTSLLHTDRLFDSTRDAPRHEVITDANGFGDFELQFCN